MKNVYRIAFKYADLEITVQDIAEVIGYTGSRIPEMERDYIKAVLTEAEDYCELECGFRICNHFEYHKDFIVIEGISFSTGKLIASPIREADAAAVFVCTGGPKLSAWSKQIFADDPVKGYIVDIFASEIVEKAADKIHKIIGETVLPRKKHITNRYSPGYCGWDVSEQRLLFSLLPKKFCGVSLSESALMIPEKSVSGIVGIGERAKYRNYFCDICPRTDCLLSKRGRK